MEQPVSKLQYSRYLRLIDYAIKTPFEGKGEIHHIVPKSMGGSNQKSNLVKLSFRMHFLAHRLLWKAYRNSKMANAFWTMACCNNISLNSKTYSEVRSLAVEAISRSRKGKTTSEKHKQIMRSLMKGRSLSKETKEKLSRAKKGKKKPEGFGEKMSLMRTGKKHSLETRKKMSLAKKGKKPNNWKGYKVLVSNSGNEVYCGQS